MVDFSQTGNILHCDLCLVSCDPWKRKEEMPQCKEPFSIRIPSGFFLTDVFLKGVQKLGHSNNHWFRLRRAAT